MRIGEIVKREIAWEDNNGHLREWMAHHGVKFQTQDPLPLPNERLSYVYWDSISYHMKFLSGQVYLLNLVPENIIIRPFRSECHMGTKEASSVNMTIGGDRKWNSLSSRCIEGKCVLRSWGLKYDLCGYFEQRLHVSLRLGSYRCQ